MPKNKISEYSSNPANNTDIGSIDIAEGCAPSGINNAIRELMAQLKDQQSGTDGDSLTVGGTLSVAGTSTLTGAVTATAGVTGNLTGNVTGNIINSATTLQLQASGATVANFTNVGGTSPRITGSVGSGTKATRLLFQNSDTNGSTNFGIIPNGTSVISQFQAFSTSDPDNCSVLFAGINGTSAIAYFNSSIFGTGTQLPLAFQVGGATQMQLTTTGNLQFNSGYGSAAVAYGCRAWVNFNGTGTVAIRGSGNVSSITDNGTGDYTVNFTTAMPDANYATVSTTDANRTAGYNATAQTTAAVNIFVATTSTTAAYDPTYCHVAVLR